MALHHGVQDRVGLLHGEAGIDAVGEGLHGPARGRRPCAVELAFVATDAAQLLLQLAREGVAIPGDGRCSVGEPAARWPRRDGHHHRRGERPHSAVGRGGMRSGGRPAAASVTAMSWPGRCFNPSALGELRLRRAASDPLASSSRAIT